MPERDDDIRWALSTILERNKLYLRRRDYYRGRHNLLFATDKFRNTFGHLFQAFSDNLCQKVVDVTANRLRIRGFSGEDATPAQEIYGQRYMRRIVGETMLTALHSGDSYAVIWPEVDRDGSTGPVRFWLNEPTLMVVRYDPDQMGVMQLAAKLWVSGGSQSQRVWRLNLYYPDRIEKLQATRSTGEPPKDARGFVPYVRTGDDGELGGVEEHELDRVPVIHLANNAPVGHFGMSELDQVMPLQDALNKSVADMLVAMEFGAYRQRYVTGVQVQPRIDPMTGNVDERDRANVGKAPFEPGPERLWFGGPGTQFGDFETTDLAQFITVQDSMRAEIARVSDTPVHELLQSTGDWPSGESLKISESSLIKKCEDRAEGFGDSLLDGFSIAAALDRNGPAVDLDIDISWEPFASREAKHEAEVAVLKKQVGVSNSQNQREMGYDEDEIEAMRSEATADAASLAEANAAVFDRGGVPASFPATE